MHRRGAVPRTAKRRVLVVDDNEDLLVPLALLLRDAGHEVATAKDGPSALTVAKKFAPDVALIDIQLPGGMDGHQLAARLRATLGRTAPRLIAFSGDGSAQSGPRRGRSAFAEHLPKLADFEVLLAAIDRRPR